MAKPQLHSDRCPQAVGWGGVGAAAGDPLPLRRSCRQRCGLAQVCPGPPDSLIHDAHAGMVGGRAEGKGGWFNGGAAEARRRRQVSHGPSPFVQRSLDARQGQGPWSRAACKRLTAVRSSNQLPSNFPGEFDQRRRMDAQRQHDGAERNQDRHAKGGDRQRLPFLFAQRHGEHDLKVVVDA